VVVEEAVMAACRSTTDRKTPRFSRRLLNVRGRPRWRDARGPQQLTVTGYEGCANVDGGMIVANLKG
jgi:hypothetical protein